MAHVQKLPDDALNAIAEQVGRLYPSLDNNVTQGQPSAELTETFPVWFLSINAINTGNGNLLELAQDTLRWHSQIWIDGKPEAVVRTMASSDDISPWTVKQILKGDLAKTVDDAIHWIDAEVDTDPLVRILEIPTFFMTALWLIDGQESSVIIARHSGNLQGLSPLVQYSSQEFLRVLRREPHAIGIHNESSRPPRQDKQNTSERQIFNILSIGGDGIGDIVPAMVLAEIEERTGQSTANNFDFIIGNSIGRVLTLGLGATGDDGEPEYKAKDLVGIYENLRNRFFNFSRKDSDSFLTTPILPIEDVLGSYFQSTVLGDILEKTRAVVSYYDVGIGAWTPAFAKRESAHAIIKEWPIASAVTIGSTFFSPVVSFYAEAKRIMSQAEPPEHFQSPDIFILSVGNVQATTDFQELSSLGYNCVSLHTPLNAASIYANKTFGDNITDPRSLANALIESSEFQEVCNRLTMAI